MKNLKNLIPLCAAKNPRTRIIYSAALFILILILVGTLMPGKDKISVLRGSGSLLGSIYGRVVSQRQTVAVDKDRSRKKRLSTISLVIEKSGHFILFGCLAFLLALREIKAFKLSLLFNMGVLAAGTEFLQIFIPGRCPQVTDMMIDMSGVLFALTLLWGFKKWRGYGGGPKALRDGNGAGQWGRS